LYVTETSTRTPFGNVAFRSWEDRIHPQDVVADDPIAEADGADDERLAADKLVRSVVDLLEVLVQGPEEAVSRDEVVVHLRDWAQ
jgi:hypothetical protein